MLATSSQPGMFPISSSDNQLTLVHTLPPPGSTTVSVQPMNTMPSTSGQVIPVTPGLCLPVMSDVQTGVKKSYPCSYCDKQFGSRYNATRHEKGCKMAPPGSGGNQTNPEPILCPNCGKQFQTHDGMTRHMRKKCKLSAEYNQPAMHQRWTGKKIHLCKYCGKQFSTKWNAIRHENLFHSTDEPVLHSLMYVSCNQQQETSMPRKPERYCRFCGSYFSTKYNAIRHEKICTRVNQSSLPRDGEVKTTSMTQTKVTNMEIDTHANLQPDVEPTTQAVLQVQTQQQQIVIQQRQAQQQQPQVQQVQVQQQNQPQQQQLNQQQIQQLQQAVQLQRQQQQPQIQQHEVQQNQQQQLIIQHQIPHQHTHQQQTVQHQQPQQVGIQQTQQVNIAPQQVVLIQPYHVCKFCNKQLDSKCDPTPILREELQNGTVNTSQIHGTSFQLQTPINPTIITGVSLPTMLALPHNITIPIQAQATQRAGNAQQIITNSPQIITQQQQVQTQPQQIQHQVRVQLQPQNLQTQQVVAQVVAQPQVQTQQAQITQQAPNPQQRQMQQTPTTQNQPPPRASPTSISSHQKPHGCKYCSKHFATKWYLDQHEKIHTGQAVTCNICNKSFVTRWHLDKHVRVHLGGNKKTKRETEHSEPGEATFSAADTIITVTEGAGNVQSNTINGATDVMVVPLSSFNVTTENRSQLPQFGLSPLAEQEQVDK